MQLPVDGIGPPVKVRSNASLYGARSLPCFVSFDCRTCGRVCMYTAVLRLSLPYERGPVRLSYRV